jgi:hypothetical protein
LPKLTNADEYFIFHKTLVVVLAELWGKNLQIQQKYPKF